jgi:hypothetical protein
MYKIPKTWVCAPVFPKKRSEPAENEKATRRPPKKPPTLLCFLKFNLELIAAALPFQTQTPPMQRVRVKREYGVFDWCGNAKSDLATLQPKTIVDRCNGRRTGRRGTV